MSDNLAGFDGSRGSHTPFHLFAGDAPVVTDRATVASGEDLEQYTVVAFDADGKLVAWDPTATTTIDVTDVAVDTLSGGTGSAEIPGPESKAIGVLMYAVDATEGDAPGMYYSAGFFNHEALVWPEAVSTLDARRAAFAGTPISVGALL